MVKRQTVWLSTMMVLSLMLIGYYTMNNGAQTTSGSSPNGSVATTAGTPPATGTNATSSSNATQSSGQTSGNQAGTQTGQTPSQTSATDWFVSTQTQLEQEMAQNTDNLRAVIANNNSSATQISQAEQQLKQLNALQGGLANARDMVIGQGYQDCVIIPNMATNSAMVYVKSSSLTAAKAVAVMNVVSQQLNIPITDVVVKQKS